MTQPIKPKDVELSVTKPDEVIEVFNELILKYWDGHSAVFKQEEAAILIASRMGTTQRFLFDNHYLDVEPIYRKMGWKVEYDKPGYNESYPATFTFSKK